jgi:8-oxo-dGTP pyrophosphatase MutT (NUDIX family)
MGFLKKIKQCNQFTLEDKTPFMVDNQRVGWIKEEFISYILKDETFEKTDEGIHLNKSLETYEQKNKYLDAFAKKAFKDKITNRYMNELYPVLTKPTSKPKCLMDRSISTLLGILSFGQHLNGYVKDKDGLKMWIGRRSYTKGYENGKLDHIVAGGLPYGISLEENLQKECYEEAGIVESLAQKAKSVGFVRYNYDYELGGKEDILYCYDLELSPEFKPFCTDGEVEEFYLMPIEEVADIVKNSDEFKSNCNLVIIDFLVRHGYIKSSDNNFLEIVDSLRNYTYYSE